MVQLFLCVSVRPDWQAQAYSGFNLSVCSPVLSSVTKILKTNKPMLTIIGTHGLGLQGKGMKRSTLEVRRS